MKKIFFLLAAASVMFAACNPEEQKEQTKAATVSVEAGDVTTSSVTFTVTSENATAVAYVCVEGSAPSGEAILEKGTSVEPNTSAPVTVNGLTDGATYTIVAAAMNELGVVASKPVTMTTTDVPADPKVVITEIEATSASFTFVVTPTDATKCAYKVYAAGAEAAAGDILAEGTEVSATEEQEVTISGLEDGDYFVVAAVQNGTTTAMSEQLSFSIATLEEIVITEFNYATASVEAGKIRVKFVYDNERGNPDNYLQITFNATELLDGTYSIAENTIDNTQEYEDWYGYISINAVTNHYYYSWWETEYGNEYFPDLYVFSSLSVTVAQNNGVYTVSGTGVQYSAYWEDYFDAKDNKKLVFEYQGTIDGLSSGNPDPDPEPEPEPDPTPGDGTYSIAGYELKYADDLKDGGLYVIFSNYYDTMAWTEVDGVLSMSEQSYYEISESSVFEYKEDSSKLDTSFDDYGNWSAGTWKSVSNGKYLDADLGFTADVDNALYLEYANNWGGYNASNELYVLDVYLLPIGAETQTIWYMGEDEGFVIGNNGYGYDGGAGTAKRKYVVYEVAKN